MSLLIWNAECAYWDNGFNVFALCVLRSIEAELSMILSGFMNRNCYSGLMVVYFV